MDEGNDPITAAGLFTASGGENMFAIASTPLGITKTSDYSLKLRWEGTFE